MFNKLLSNLPFNPSLINQVAFYTKRLRRESSIRRLGFVLVVLTMVVQLFAVIAPAQPTLARDGNDIVPGGFSTKEQAIQLCQNNISGFSTILKHFAITCDNMAAGNIETIRSTDQNNQLFSMGRQPQGPRNVQTGKLTDELPVTIEDSTYYLRRLSSWDSGRYSTYKVLSVGNIFSVHFYILFSCGNIVQTGKPTPPPAPTPTCQWNPIILSTDPKCLEPCPYNNSIAKNNSACKPCKSSQNQSDVLACLVFSKKASNNTRNIPNANNTTAKAGDTINYTLSVKNTGSAILKSYKVQENVADVLEYADIISLHGAKLDNKNIASWSITNLTAGGTYNQTITVRVKNPIPQTPSPCANKTVVRPCLKSGSFDHTMTNVFHSNTVNIKLPPTITKTTETVSSTLPETGPGTSLIIGFVLTTIVGYFFARSRLLAKELDIVRTEYVNSGDI